MAALLLGNKQTDSLQTAQVKCVALYITLYITLVYADVTASRFLFANSWFRYKIRHITLQDRGSLGGSDETPHRTHRGYTVVYFLYFALPVATFM